MALATVLVLAGCTAPSSSTNPNNSADQNRFRGNRDFNRGFDQNRGFGRDRNGTVRGPPGGFEDLNFGPPQNRTAAEVAVHHSASDCWMIIHGKVYSMARFVSFIPNGQSMVPSCGTDATTVFDNLPTGGTNSQVPPSGMLNRFYIGDLVQ
ncbi:MAG: cytochrome b5-like heme/steroid binding domain-containing protein [Candidatus Micrarchaeota archaeon]